MKLVGRLQSPFVRRVAMVMRTLDIGFEHLAIPIAEQDRVRRFNPLGRVPALVLDDGEVLVDSHAIVDWLTEQAPGGESILPRAGLGRRRILRASAILSGALEKIIAVGAERRRPPERQSEAFVAHALAQASSGLSALEAEAGEPWFLGAAGPSLVDLSLAPGLDYAATVEPGLVAPEVLPALGRIADRVRTLPAYAATRPE